MHPAHKVIQNIKRFLAPTIPYSLEVSEAVEICLLKIQHGLPIRRTKGPYSYLLEINQFFKLLTDDEENPQFKLLVRIDPMMISSMVITGKFQALDSQKTVISGGIRSVWLLLPLFMFITGIVITFVSLFGDDAKALLCGLVYTPAAFYINFEKRKVANVWVISRLREVFES